MNCGVTRRNRERNEEIRRRCGLQRSLSERGEAAVLRSFGHVERMEGERLVKKIYRVEVGVTEGEVDQLERWMDRLKRWLNDRGLTIPEDRRKRRRIVGERRR